MEKTCSSLNGPSPKSRPAAWDFQRMFHPKSVAVIGVSLERDRHPANVIFNKINLRYPVDVFPVNPRGGELFGQKVYTGIQEIPQPVDLAIIVVRAEYSLDTLKACIDAGAGGATIISGGFAEVGRPDLQRQLAELGRHHGFPFIGPNCLGVYMPGGMDTFFIPSERMIRPQTGKVALVSQSGGVLVDLMTKFAEQGVGFSLGVSIGNKALIGELDLLRYLAEDPNTGVIAFYIEGFARGEGREFVLAGSLLSGYRGGVVVNRNELIQTLICFSEFVMAVAEMIESIDLNPVMCSAERCVVADARIILASANDSTPI